MKRLKTDSAPNVRYLSKEEKGALRTALEARQESQRTDRLNYIDWRNARHLEPPKSLTDMYTDYLMPMVLLAINTGVRRGELFSLKWSDVDLKGRLLTIAGKTAKSGSTRHIPLNDEAFAVLVAWSNQSKDSNKESRLVFPSPVTAERMDNITSSWKNLLKDSGIKNFRFHDLRHHFASMLIMGGVDLNTVRELLGHQDIETTLRYAHLAPEHKAAAVALLNQLGS
jgi:integrase